MNVSDFGFDLPAGLIAQAPAPERGASKLLVVNDTKVFPARLLGARVPSGGAVECLLLANHETEGQWDALVHPGQKLQPGSRMVFRGSRHVLHGEVLEHHYHGRRTIRLWSEDGATVEDAIDDIGHMPLPPYI